MFSSTPTHTVNTNPSTRRPGRTNPREARAHPLLVQTYLHGSKVQLFSDFDGLYVIRGPNLPNTPDYHAAPVNPVFNILDVGITHVVNVNLSLSYLDLVDRIIADASRERGRARSTMRNLNEASWRTGVQNSHHLPDSAVEGRQNVSFKELVAIWAMPGGVTGHTVLCAANCRSVLELISNRGWRDILVAIYEECEAPRDVGA